MSILFLDFHVAERDVSSFTRGKNSSLEEEEIKERNAWKPSLYRESQTYSRLDLIRGVIIFNIITNFFLIKCRVALEVNHHAVHAKYRK